MIPNQNNSNYSLKLNQIVTRSLNSSDRTELLDLKVSQLTTAYLEEEEVSLLIEIKIYFSTR